jgi:hypothetical protein
MDCGSGFPAANRFNAGSGDRGWPRKIGMQAKAAPTNKLTLNNFLRTFFSEMTFAAGCGIAFP